MYIRDLIPKGAMVTPKVPAYGMYQNVLLTDKRRGIFPAAVGPQGKLDMTSDAEKFVMLQGLSPAMYVPDNPKAYIDRMVLLLDEIENAIDWQFMQVGDKEKKTERTAMLPADAWDVKPGKDKDTMWVTRDSQMVYGMMPVLDYIWWMNKMLSKVVRASVPSYATAEPIGSSFLYDKEGGYKILRPKKTVNIKKSIQFEMQVPSETLPFRLRREVSKWQCLVAASIERIHDRTPHMHSFEHVDHLAMGAYQLGAFSGFSDEVKDIVPYTSEDVYQEAFSYLGLPFSKTWPDIAYNPEKWTTATQELYKAIFIHNNVLAVAGNQVKGKLIPVQYLWRRGNIHVVKQMVREYIKPPLDLGGSNNLWMQPALNTHAPFAVMWPGPVREGDCQWEGNVTDKVEVFNDTVIDRGEIALTNLEEMNSNFRTITSRDGRVRLVTDKSTEYFVIYNEVQPNGVRRQELPTFEELMLSYVTDPTLKFTGAVYLTASHMRPRFDVTLGPIPMVDANGILKRAIPGGIVDTDASTIQGLADKNTPTSVEVAELRSGDASIEVAGVKTKIPPPEKVPEVRTPEETMRDSTPEG